MNIKICDACGVVLEEEIREVATDWTRRFDLCANCKEKFEQIKEEFFERDKQLEEERKALFKEYKKRLEDMGINYEGERKGVVE